jgi:hypothetical protein
MKRFHQVLIFAARACVTAASIICLACITQLAHAVPVTYIYAGIGTGQLGNFPFSSTQFTITAMADTSHISIWPGGGNVSQNTHLSTTINIAGLGSFAITTPSHSWMDTALPSGVGGLGQDLFVNWITFRENALIGYGLNTSIGPVAESSPEDVGQFHDVSTTGGALTFNSIAPVTFTAIVTPEPSSIALALVGSCRAWWLRLGRRRR